MFYSFNIKEQNMISVKNLTKVYKIGKKGQSKDVVALNNVSVDFPDKGLVFLLGKSGSGKSTLLNSIGGLDKFDSGEIIIKGKSSKDFKQSDFDSYRNTFIGFIFQEYNVLEEFTVGKNLALALELQGKNASKEEVNKLLEQVDLEGYYKRKPNQLSGGQKQRVAIARALIKNPEIIMADEPTGALDSATGKQVMDTLKKLSQTKLVIIVSHDREFAEIYGDRVIELKDGQIIRDETKTEVEAVKTESGVSFIDNKIIHIKKGQKISKGDLDKINQMIVNNANNEDTIISFDQKSNQDVKKSAFITDDGNREVFKTTTKDDIKRTNYDPKDFKMIKSKLKFKDSFKMGASSLKHKPIRLMFTILLSVIAFGMFGVVNTMASFNRADSIYATVNQLNNETVSINKRIDLDNYSTFPMTNNEIAKFQSDNPNYTFQKVVGSGIDFYISGLSSSDSYTYQNTINRHKISGVMAINEDVKNQFNLQLIYGNLPTNDDEMCISSNMLSAIINTYNNVSSFSDIEGKSLNFHNITRSFKIVGVLQDNTDMTKYKDLSGDQASVNKEYNLYQEFETVMNYSLVNMCYTTEAGYNNCVDNYNPPYSINVNAYVKGEEYNGGVGYSFRPLSKSNYTPSYLKSGFDIANLQDNQIIMSKDILTLNLQINEQDIESKIEEGLFVPFGAGYDAEKNHLFDLQVVGYYISGGTITVTDNFYNENFKGASYLITNLKGTSADKDLIRYFENNSSMFYYSIQCAGTPVLDEFGSMVQGMANILLYIGIGLAVFVVLMLMNFISTSISYKKREIGVLRAIGARGKDVFSIFFSESFIICMINFLLSAVGSAIVCNIINNSLVSNLGISLTLMMFGFKQVALLFIIALAVAFISTFLPVYKFAKKNPIDSINNR